MTITQNGVNRQDITNEVTGYDTIRRCMIGISDNFPGKIWYYYLTSNNLRYLVNFEPSSYSNIWYIGSYEELHMQIATSPNDSNIVYLGKTTPAIFVETALPIHLHDIATNTLNMDEEASDVTDFLHSDIRAMQVLNLDGNDRLYVGHDGGVAWGEDGNGSCGDNMFCWHQISDDGTNGLQTNEFYGISISNSENLVIQGGTQDCSSFIYDEKTNLWYHAYYSDGIEGAVSPDNSNKFITGGGVFGAYSYRLYDLSDPDLKVDILEALGTLNNRAKIDPANGNVLYIGSDQLYKISNCFSSPNITTINTPASTPISAFAIAKNNSNIKYVAEALIAKESGDTHDHMWRFDPAVSSWVEISSNISQYSYSYATDIVINPEDDDELWISMGTSSYQNNKVFHSADGGENWNVLNTGYPPGFPANRLIYDHILNSLFVATDVGIFRWDLSNPTQGWLYLSNTMPFKLVTDIERDYVNHRLIAGTYGRGIWEAELPEDTCYDKDPLYISSLVSWHSNQSICQDVYIQNGGRLLISADVTLGPGRTLFIEDGGIVTINGGHLYNGNSEVYQGGSISIINNGSILLAHGDLFDTEIGAIINIPYGSIDKNE